MNHDLGLDLELDENISTDSEGLELDDGLGLELEDTSIDEIDLDEFGVEDTTQPEDQSSKLSTVPSVETKTLDRFLMEALLASNNPIITQKNIGLLLYSSLPKEVLHDAEVLRTQLLNASVDKTIKFHQLFETNTMIEKCRKLESHIQAVADGFKAKEAEMLETINGYKTSCLTLQDEYNRIKGTKRETSTSFTVLSERLRVLQLQITQEQSERATVTLKHNLVLNFLKGLHRIYSDKTYLAHYIQYRFQNVDLISNIKLNGSTVTAECVCGEQLEFQDSKLPKLQVGKLTYNIDILGIIDEIYKVLTWANDENCKRCINVILTGVDALGRTDVRTEIDKLIKPLDKLSYLYKQEFIEAIPNSTDKNKLLNTLIPQAKIDARTELFRLLTTLCLSTDTIPPHIATFYQQRRQHPISNPTPLNILSNTHPLLGTMIGSDIINSPNNGKMANYLNIGTQNGIALGEWIYSQLHQCFNYPVANMMYSSKMSTVLTVANKPSLRINIPDIICHKDGCAKRLLIYGPCIDACTRYLDYYLSRPVNKQSIEPTTLSVTALLAPVMTPVNKNESKQVTSKRSSGGGYNYLSRIAEMKSKRETATIPAYNKVTNANQEFKHLTSKDTVDRNAYRVKEVQQSYGLVSEALAIQLCQAFDDKQSIRIREILDENARLKAKAKGETLPPTQTQQEPEIDLELEASVPEVEVPAVEPELGSEDYLAQYGDVDLDTLSYEELTSKGLYKLENFNKFYNLSSVEYDEIEKAVVKIYGDENGLQAVPKAIRESVLENYEIRQGIPDDTDLYVL